jgi:disulfide bond formation protein DsbB
LTRRGILIGLTSVLVAVTIGCGAGGGGAPTATRPAAPPTATLPPGEATRGKQLYTQGCAGCHGPDARGLPGLGKDMTTSAFVKSQTDTQLVAFIKQGRPANDPANTTRVEMPPRGGIPTLTDAQLADIVAYLRTLQR